MAFKCWMVIVQISWGYARDLWGLKAPMDLFIGWGMNPGCTWGQNSGVPVKHMVHYGPCLVTGYRRLFLCFFSFLCQPLTFIRLDNDLVTLGLSLSDLISCSLPTIVYMLCIVASDDVIFIFFPASSSSKNCIPQLWMVARGVAWVELKDLCKLTW